MTLRSAELTAEIRRIEGRRRLLVHARRSEALASFEGSAHELAGGSVLEGELSPKNARALRGAFPHLRPRPVGPLVSAGVGDRLGLAGAGHVDAFRTYGVGVFPVFAQQSIRELERLGREPHEVIDAATYGAVAAGWTLPVGADLDHIRRIDDIDRGVQAGFTTFTLDPGDHVRRTGATPSRQQVESVDWASFGETPEALVARHAGRPLDIGDRTIVPGADDVMRAAVKYADAVVAVARMSRRVHELATGPVEVEVAVDETAQRTTFFEHHFIASELTRFDVTWTGLAPRYIDGFEKGVEFRGEVEALVADVRGHAAIARQHGGYKLSLHSGSDKFGIYERVLDAAGGRMHLKTSGTSYLAALSVIACREPALFRDIYRESVNAYEQSRNSYQVSSLPSADIDAIPDADLPEVIEAAGSRQVLHVGYGAALTRTDAAGRRYLDIAARRALANNEDEYRSLLHRHIGRHLVPFSAWGAR